MNEANEDALNNFLNRFSKLGFEEAEGEMVISYPDYDPDDLVQRYLTIANTSYGKNWNNEQDIENADETDKRNIARDVIHTYESESPSEEMEVEYGGKRKRRSKSRKHKKSKKYKKSKKSRKRRTVKRH